MPNIPTERYQRDIKISATVAAVFIVVLFGLFLLNAKYGFSERFVSFFVSRFFGAL